MISSLSVAKGIVYFVELANSMPKYNFILIISSDKKNIDSFFRNIKMNNNIHIYSNITDIRVFILKTDLLINMSIPSLCVETFGMTILEAMTYGIPSIAPNIGGPIELIKNNFNGIILDVTNMDLVKENIENLLIDKELYTYMSRNSFECSRTKFGLKAKKEYEKIINEVYNDL